MQRAMLQGKKSGFYHALNLIRIVPGFDKNPLTAIQVLSEIGGDMSVFPTAKEPRLMGRMLSS